MSHELRLTRPQTQQQKKKLEHMYLKFLTQITQSVEKTVNLYVFKLNLQTKKYKCSI